ncbi:peptidoglycan D,D-transpeptidase FtsI family protein [Kordiimonas aquimaris]|uniref:peptidoglycan D,D-transpeptidase FtsI family protein n=1 Tax=Kordiimonas aquimaris TaxID=707591 RepID=UPI0021D352F3|nr:penicillin-binding protein 2 [Kordiimonas aquimaris]
MNYLSASKSQSNMFAGDLKAPTIAVARTRLMFGVFFFLVAFVVMGARTVELGMSTPITAKQTIARHIEVPATTVARADIVDRNGEALAINLKSSSLYANPKMISNPEAVAQKLNEILPSVPRAGLLQKLKSGRSFVWIKRKLTPKQKWDVNALGVPGLKFQEEEDRLYPHGRLASHVLGYVDVDGNGIAGVEHYFDDQLSNSNRSGEALQLSLDIRVQYALADELEAAMRAHRAKGAAGLVMDVNTGELLALVSMPDYDPNNISGVSDDELFNRASKGVYELGSTFKTFTFANALDDGVATLEDGYDATKPLKVARFLIRDDHPKKRYLTLPEIFAFSSNIGTAQMALDIGSDRQREFMGDLGLLNPAALELPEVGAPMYPASWRKVSTVTISYGHGIAVSPVQLATSIASVVNGGSLNAPTLVRTSAAVQSQRQVISQSTSRQMRQLLRLAVTKGTGGRADARGYRVGGKTGTAEKASGGGYDRKSLISSFVGVYPMDDPQYVVFALLDEPQGTKETFGFASGGWVAAPVVKNVIMRTAPLLGVLPKWEDEGLYQKVALMIDED